MSWNSFVLRWNKFIKKLSIPTFKNRIYTGLKNTLIIAFVGFLIGFVLGSVLAVLKLLPKEKKINKVLSKICDVYVAIFRGTPMVVQLLIAYYMFLPILGINANGFSVCVVMFGLNSAAYVCEIMRGGILSIDKGQTEAGRSLGLSHLTTMVKIVIPQAIKNIIPTLGNELITLVKETSIVSFVGAMDLFTAFQMIGAANYEYMIPYLFMALIYIALVVILTVIVKLVERRLRASDKH